MIMTLAASFENLLRCIGQFRADLLERLRWAVTNDKPLGDDHALAGRFEDWTTEMATLMDDAEQAAIDGQDAAVGKLDLGTSGAATLRCHQFIRQCHKLFDIQLTSPQTIVALQHLESEGRGRWSAWVRSVSEGLADCRADLEAAEDAIIECWAQWSEVAVASAGQSDEPAARPIKSRRASIARRP
jgi:hypothetical protein